MPDLGKSCADAALEAGQGGMKRDLSRRHVNMIAIAGMIVSHFVLCPFPNKYLQVTYCRVPGYSSRPVMPSLWQGQSAP